MFKKLLNRLSQQPETPFIAVVSGLPRSGTSMMMKMLEAGGIPPLTDQIRSADDDNPKGYYEFERVKKMREGDVGWLPEARGKAVKIIATLVPYLPEGFDYKILFMRRALPEILASQRKMLLRRGEDPDKVSDVQLTDLFTRHLQQVQTWLADQEQIQLLDVDYRDMVADPGLQAEAVNAFLGGNLDTARMADVVDPALYRQRK